MYYVKEIERKEVVLKKFLTSQVIDEKIGVDRGREIEVKDKEIK